jgi:phosphatidylglycerol:prolipoprotein diacylglycerol transferase
LAPAVDLSLLALIGYWLGARMLHAILTGRPTATNEPGAWGGQIVFGLLAAGYLLIARAPFRDLADALAVAWAALTVPIKVGCFLAGCCHGSPTGVPWAVRFPADSYCRLAGQPIHPTQLYDAVAAAVLGVVLAGAYLRGIGRGRLLPAFLAGYGVTKFASEIFRGDHRFAVAGGMTASMLIEAATAVGCLGLLLAPGLWMRVVDALERRRPATSEEPAAPLRDRVRIFVFELGQAALILLIAAGAGAGRTWPLRAKAVYFAGFVAMQFVVPRLDRFRLFDRTGVPPGILRRATRGLIQALGVFTVVALARPLFDRRGRTLGDAAAETTPAAGLRELGGAARPVTNQTV